MRVAVIGAGIVGVTTAYELARAGHEVRVFERRNAVAAETSFANAGVLAPGYVTPWAAPGMPAKVLRGLLGLGGRDAAVRLAGWSAWRERAWVRQWLRACKATAYHDNRAAMLRLAQFSRQRLLELTASLDLQYEQASGFTVLLRGARELAAAQPGLSLLRELGVQHQILDGAQCRAVEPGLSLDTALHAAIHLPDDGVGNCRQFAQLMRQAAQDFGAQFHFSCSVEALQSVPSPPWAKGSPPLQLLRQGDAKPQAFDAIVVCAGVQANALLAPLGLALPLAPVFGYSITATLRAESGNTQAAGATIGPQAALMDERFKVAISRLGQRVRVAGIAELGGEIEQLNPKAIATLHRVLHDWFPGAAVPTDVQQWKGARPMLPDGPPVIGATPVPGLWLNLGHGSSGWALACGSACIVAEALSGRAAPLDTRGLGLERVRQK
jgi:D-amino-acid dehydrogenase